MKIHLKDRMATLVALLRGTFKIKADIIAAQLSSGSVGDQDLIWRTPDNTTIVYATHTNSIISITKHGQIFWSIHRR